MGAAGLMFSVSLIAVFHFALGWQKFRTLMTVIMMLVFMGVVGGLVKFLVATKPEAKKAEEQVKIIPVVKVIEVRPAKGGVEIEAEGVVESQRVVSLTAEISGKLIRVNQKLVPGGTVSRDEILVEIEPADYRAALEQAKAVKERAKMSVADAQLALAQEVARREQALRDWRELGQGEPSALLERKPQLTSAEARLASARADVESAVAEVERAQRNLERTVIRAPFDAVVRQESVEVGAVLVPGMILTTLFSERDLEVELPLKLEDYAFLERDERGSVAGQVNLSAKLGLREVTWPGRLVRTSGELTRASLSASVVVAIDSSEEEGELNLPPTGLFVEAELKGQAILGAMVIPREAVREGRRLMVVEADGLLAFREVKVVRSFDEEVWVTEGVEIGEQVIVTRISGATEGMEVQVSELESEEEEE